MTAPSSQPDARTHRMENASVYCRYCGAHPDNWQREQCEHREPDARTAREHAETAVQEAKKLTDLLRRGGPGWFLFAKKIPDVCDAALDALLALVERLEQERDEATDELAAELAEERPLHGETIDRAEAAEARAQRYREALKFYAAPNFDGGMVARRALACDPLVCRDPDLCWGTGTCPRDPACNE